MVSSGLGGKTMLPGLIDARTLKFGVSLFRGLYPLVSAFFCLFAV